MSDQQRFAKIEKRISQIEHLLNAPRKQDTKATGPKDTSEQNGHTAPGEPLASDSSAKDRSYSTDKRHHDRRPWWIRMWRWKPWKRILTVLVGLAGIGYALVTYYQWRDLDRHFRIDERAWIHIKIKEPAETLADFSKIGVTANLVNIGKTPAKHIKITANAEVIDRLVSPSFDYENGSAVHTTLAILFPNDPSEDIFIGANFVISAPQRQDLGSGKKYLVIYSIATWDDIFGNPHWAHFCVRRAFTPGPSASRTCSDYNDTDAQ
jgi:hypothetical protein